MFDGHSGSSRYAQGRRLWPVRGHHATIRAHHINLTRLPALAAKLPRRVTSLRSGRSKALLPPVKKLWSLEARRAWQSHEDESLVPTRLPRRSAPSNDRNGPVAERHQRRPIQCVASMCSVRRTIVVLVVWPRGSRISVKHSGSSHSDYASCKDDDCLLWPGFGYCLETHILISVSYTHLTLPTSDLV